MSDAQKTGCILNIFLIIPYLGDCLYESWFGILLDHIATSFISYICIINTGSDYFFSVFLEHMPLNILHVLKRDAFWDVKPRYPAFMCI